jgi:tRNA (guanosine-2'-O-)-methyltransferase
MLSEERIEKLLRTIGKRQWDVTVILENVHDPHNLGAVLRSCETVGITEVYILYTEQTTNAARYIGRNASGGVSKWIKAHFFTDLNACFTAVKSKYDKIYATHLYEDSVSIYEKKLTTSMAFLFGNEHNGISKEALALTDGNIMIPMQGLAESLNVSVACSIMLYEMMRQRLEVGLYDKSFDLNDEKSNALLHSFLQNTQPRIYEKDSTILYKIVLEYLAENKVISNE